jgi:hypothetical protein
LANISDFVFDFIALVSMDGHWIEDAPKTMRNLRNQGDIVKFFLVKLLPLVALLVLIRSGTEPPA